MAGRIAVVNASNKFVRWEKRALIHQHRLVHRSIHVLVFDGQERLLIQRRHASKDTFPRHWDTSCAGHVEESDYVDGPDDHLEAVYYSVAQRELEEELGVTPSLIVLGSFPPVAGVHYEQIRAFKAVSDGPFRPAPDEVEEVRLVTPQDYAELAGCGEPITGTLRLFVGWLRDQGAWG